MATLGIKRMVLGGLAALSLAVGTGALAPAPAAHAQRDLASVPVRAIAIGDTYNRTLSPADAVLANGARADFYQFQGQVGRCVRITMDSQNFDTYLLLRQGSATGAVLAQNDDGGPGLNSRVLTTLPRTGTYVIEATSFAQGQFGT